MNEFYPFEMERMMSAYEQEVEFNLSESGVHPITLGALLGEHPGAMEELLATEINYPHVNGIPQLRDHIALTYDGATRDDVLVTVGAIEANYLAIRTLLNPGDEIVIMLPNYMQIWGLARSMGVDVKPFHLKEELNWAPHMEELKRQVTPKTKMIALCNPNNPTGATLTQKEMEEIVELAQSVDAWIYCDEIYRGAELEGDETPSFHGMYHKVIVDGGLSKAYGLPGLRMGWLVGPSDIIDNAWSYNDYITISTGILSQAVAQKILEPAMRARVLKRNRAMLRENIAAVKEWMAGHGDLFHMVPPRAGGMAFVRYNLDINSRKLADRLRIEKNVFIMDGDCFGMDRYLRIGFGAKKEYLLQGLQRVDQLLREILHS